MAELVDALRSGRSGRKAVEVRVLFWAPFDLLIHYYWLDPRLCIFIELGDFMRNAK